MPEHERDLRWWRVVLKLGVLALFFWLILRPEPSGERPWFVLWSMTSITFGFLYYTHRSATRHTHTFAFLLMALGSIGIGLWLWIPTSNAARIAFMPWLAAYLVLARTARKSLAPRPSVDPEVFS